MPMIPEDEELEERILTGETPRDQPNMTQITEEDVPLNAEQEEMLQ